MTRLHTHRRRIVRRSLGLSAALLLAACGTSDTSEEFTPGGDVIDLTDTTVETPDADSTLEPPGADATTDVGVTPPPDTTPPDPGATCGELGLACCDNDTCNNSLVCSGDICRPASTVSVCGDVTPACFEPDTGESDAEVRQIPGSPPTLGGGETGTGAFVLTGIDVYSDGTFSDLVGEIELESAGNTVGGIEFRDGEWGFSANLDLVIGANIPGAGAFDQPVEWALFGGGCFQADGNRILGDILECGGEWPEGFVPPETINFSVDGDEVQLLLIITRANIASALPANIASFADFVITGDLPILLRFTR